MIVNAYQASPTPRLRHIRDGESVRLRQDPRQYTVHSHDDTHAYLTHSGGTMIVSRCYPVQVADVGEWLRERFGKREEVAA